MMSPRDKLVSHLSTPAVVLDPKTDVAELLRLSQSLGIHHFPLVDAAGLGQLVALRAHVRLASFNRPKPRLAALLYCKVTTPKRRSCPVAIESLTARRYRECQ